MDKLKNKSDKELETLIQSPVSRNIKAEAKRILQKRKDSYIK